MTSSKATGTIRLARRRRWLVQIEGGSLRLVDGDAALGDLVRRRQVTLQSKVYEISSGPRAIGDVLQAAWPPPEPDSEPPIRQPAFRTETRSPERVKLSEELAVLNRPLEDEVEYYDEVPRGRGKRLLAAVIVFAGLAGAGYRVVAHRHRSERPGEEASSTTAAPPAAASTAVVPAKAPVTEPAPAGPDPEPEGDPPVPSGPATRPR